jgi:hypothetical protein
LNGRSVKFPTAKEKFSHVKENRAQHERKKNAKHAEKYRKKYWQNQKTIGQVNGLSDSFRPSSIINAPAEIFHIPAGFKCHCSACGLLVKHEFTPGANSNKNLSKPPLSLFSLGI